MFNIEFEQSQLTNLEYSLDKELIRSNRAGSFACSTIIGCNTRKYHGLLVAPQPTLDGEWHVLLSSLDETIIQRDAEFNIAIHKYPGHGVYNPKGHKYIRGMILDPIPMVTYGVGGVVLTKETLFPQDDDRVLIRYTLVDAHSPTSLKFKPLLAFRNRHQLSKSNVDVEKKFEFIENGIKTRMYKGYSHLFMQFSKEVEFVAAPDWNYNVEYLQEMERGYEFHEDLYVPGYFELSIEKGESVIFSAGLSSKPTKNFTAIFKDVLKKRIPRNNFENCLKNSAQQFIWKTAENIEVIAGFPWFGRWSRDSFISLPGLTLSLGEVQLCKSAIDTLVSEMEEPLFPNTGNDSNAFYNSADAPLWFFWTLQQYAEHTDTKDKIWKEYGKIMRKILEGYRDGSLFNIKMLDSGLIYAGEPGKAITWMDAVVDGKPVTPRIGMPVEINALWYNAIMFALEAANLAHAKAFTKEWKPIADLINTTFKDTFWCKDRGYIADCVNGDHKDFSVRPNMVIATSLPFSPLSEQVRKLVLDVIQDELLTNRGLRSLSPKDLNYKPNYFGSQKERDYAYHQGTVWPWLLSHFVEGYLKINGKAGLPLAKKLYHGFEDTMLEHGVCSISEVYDGDPPHKAGGAISQAWSVSEILRIGKLIEQYSK